MSHLKIHTVFSPDRPKDKNYASAFIDELGQAPADEADYYFAAGGDGTKYWSLKLSLDNTRNPVIAGTPSISNSKGHNNDHGIHTPKDLLERLQNPELITLTPLEAKITFSNGNTTVIHSFNDISVLRSDRQAGLFNIKKNGEMLYPRLMGCGAIISTGMGSTGLNDSHNGRIIPIDDNRLILNGIGICKDYRRKISNPKGFVSSKNPQDTIFEFNFSSVKIGRNVKLSYDTGSVDYDDDGSPIASIEIKSLPDKTVDIVKKIETESILRRAIKMLDFHY